MSDMPIETRGDSASRFVKIVRTILAFVIAVAVLAAAADIYRLFGFVFVTEKFLAAILALALALTFLVFPARRGDLNAIVPWYDWALSIAGFAAAAFLAYNMDEMAANMFSPSPAGLAAAWVVFLLSIEGLRRTVGWSLVFVVLFFVAYALIGHLLWGSLQTRKVELNSFIYYMIVDPSGLLGIVLNVAISIVIPFILFGAFLSASGGAAFFNDAAIAIMGRYRGGSAKMSILASGLFGSISGVVVSNIMATGVITIPLMKRDGFTPEQAAAIEASASNGGQLMPPVMGAVAFLMADFLQVPYREVAIAALIPGLLYYCALFIQADLDAAKAGIARVPESEIPKLGPVLLKGWHFFLPFAVLIYSLFWLNHEPEVAAIWASLTVMILGLTIGYNGKRMQLGEIWNNLIGTGIGALDIFMVSAGAGFIMGMLQVTGLGFALTQMLVHVGEGSVILLLIFAAIMCIILGMGMPTIGVYVLLAVLIAPSLQKVGISPMASHMFILYMGLMSMVTPPVAVAAFFAASLAKADQMKTGWVAVRFSWAAYIVPFLFVFSPTLLLQSSSILDITLAFVTAVAGVWVMCAGMVGYSFLPLGWPERIGLLTGGFGLLLPHELGAWAWWCNGLGLVLSLALLGLQWMRAKRRAGAALAQS